MKWIVTGGAGFIGSNAVARFLSMGHRVVVVDNLSRAGSSSNLAWLRTKGSFDFIKSDVRDAQEIGRVFSEHGDAGAVLHLAAQVAVTTSVTNPREDFEVNALGTFNVCDALRRHLPKSLLIYASTNKVYGKMSDLSVSLQGGRYSYAQLPKGVSEAQPLDFYSPYGCSKGAADQYVADFARIYGLDTVNFRQSCIYGPRQFGVEDQGWVAWFMIATLAGNPLTIYGDGRQVRDILFVDDLIDAYIAAWKNRDVVRGRSFNMGGGAESTLSLLELVDFLSQKCGRKIDPKFGDWRPGDQQVFICDTSAAQKALGWKRKTSRDEGLNLLWDWARSNQELFKEPLALL